MLRVQEEVALPAVWPRFLACFLHDEMVCEEWESMGLPLSLAESAAMALHSKQPLCVDPHEQEQRLQRLM